MALELFQRSRFTTRVDADAAILPHDQQVRRLWAADLLDEGIRVPPQAIAAARPGPYQLQAVIVARALQRAHRGRHRLVDDCHRLRPARRDHRIPRRPAQPGGGGRHGGRAAGRTGAPGSGRWPRGLPPAARGVGDLNGHSGRPAWPGQPSSGRWGSRRTSPSRRCSSRSPGSEPRCIREADVLPRRAGGKRSGTVPMTSNPSDSQRRTAAVLVATTALNWIARKPCAGASRRRTPPARGRCPCPRAPADHERRGADVGSLRRPVGTHLRAAEDGASRRPRRPRARPPELPGLRPREVARIA